MRRFVLIVLLATVAAPSAHAAQLRVSTPDFSPALGKLVVSAALPQTTRVGVQLASPSGKPLGWLAEPLRRR